MRVGNEKLPAFGALHRLSVKRLRHLQLPLTCRARDDFHHKSPPPPTSAQNRRLSANRKQKTNPASNNRIVDTMPHIMPVRVWLSPDGSTRPSRMACSS